MPSRPAWLSLTLLLVAIGCGSSDTSGAGGSTTGTMTIRITSPASGACVEVPVDRTVNVPVTIETSGVSLKPPGTCGASTTCGNVALFVGGVRNNAGTGQVIDLLSTPEAPLAGAIALEARLVDDAGAYLTGADGKPATADVTFEAKTSCGGTGGTGGTTGGTGGTTGGTGGTTGGTGGMTGGTGGMTGGTGGATGGTGGMTGGTGGMTGGTGGTTGGTGGTTGGTGGTTTSSTSSSGGGAGGMTGGTGGM